MPAERRRCCTATTCLLRTAADMSGRNRQSAKTSRDTGVKCGAFTLIELFVIMAVIIILMGLAFPAFTSVQNSARKTQAKNDLVQIVTAVNAFYTEYGKYPVVTGDTQITISSDLFYSLRGVASANASNPRQIVFISPPDVKDANNPRSGIATKDTTINSIAVKNGELVDPWGTPYKIAIDGTYDNQVANPYGSTGGAGSNPVRQGVIAWSLGADGTLGKVGNNIYSGSDDVISWQ